MPRIYLTYRPEEGTHDEAQAIARHLEQTWGQGHVVLSPAYEAHDILALAEGVRRCDALLLLIGPFWHQLVDEKRRHVLHEPTDYQYTELMTALELDMWISVIRLKDAPPPQASILPPDLRRLAREDSFALNMAERDEALEALNKRIRFSRRKQTTPHLASKTPRPLPPLEDSRRVAPSVRPAQQNFWANSWTIRAFLLLVALGIVLALATQIGAPNTRPRLIVSEPTQIRREPTTVTIDPVQLLSMSLGDLQSTRLADIRSNAEATPQPNLSAEDIRATSRALLSGTLEANSPLSDSATRAAQSRATAYVLATRSVEEAYARRLRGTVLDERLSISSDTLELVETLQTMRILSDDAYEWAVFSPDGRYLFVERTLGITRYDMRFGKAEREEAESLGIRRLAPLNNGGYATLFDDSRMAQVDWPTREGVLPMVHNLVGDYGEAWDVASDGDLLAFGFEDVVYIVKPRAVQDFYEVSRIPLGSPPVIMVANAGRLAVVMKDTSAAVYDMGSGEALLSLPVPSTARPIQAMSFSADGNVMALAFQDGGVDVFSVDSGERVDRLQQPYVSDVALNHNGTVAALAKEEDGLSLHLIRSTAERSHVLPSEGFVPHSVNFSPDGRTLVANDDQKVTIYGIPAR
jgi:hypothetical protein